MTLLQLAWSESGIHQLNSCNYKVMKTPLTVAWIKKIFYLTHCEDAMHKNFATSTFYYFKSGSKLKLTMTTTWNHTYTFFS